MLNLIIPTAIAGIDRGIKEHRENNDTVYDYLDGNIKVITYHNRGAFLNKGDKHPVAVAFISVIFSIIIGLVFVCTFTKRGLGALRFGLGLLLGGAFSNTYDRIKKGYVVDYIVFAKAPSVIRNIVFNIADFAIIIGALISALQ